MSLDLTKTNMQIIVNDCIYNAPYKECLDEQISTLLQELNIKHV